MEKRTAGQWTNGWPASDRSPPQGGTRGGGKGRPAHESSKDADQNIPSFQLEEPQRSSARVLGAFCRAPRGLSPCFRALGLTFAGAGLR